MIGKHENFYNEQFLQLLTQRDELAFQSLYDHLVDSFYRFLKSSYRIDEHMTQDILSDTFLKIWNSLEHLKVQSNISSYMRTILRNTSKDYFKKTREYSFSELDHLTGADDMLKFEDTIADPSDITELFQTQFQSDQIIEALEQLDVKYKEVIFLKYVEGCTNEEISKTFDISEDNVRQRLSRGLTKLRELLGSNKTPDL